MAFQRENTELRSLQRHLTIGAAALARGYIDAHTYGRTMVEVGILSEQEADDSIWLASDRLTPQQFQKIIADLEAGWVPPPTQQERYQPHGFLGAGGMGDVEERIDTVLNRKVAFKVAREGNEIAQQIIGREAHVTGSLEHPSIIPVYDLGVDGRGRPFYVMRIARESSLADVIDRIAQQDPSTLIEYTLGRLLRVFIQVCQAIDYAHSRGFAHRDLKTPNVLLGTYGEVLVVDWGLAVELGKPPPLFGGTPGYMPPEQFSMEMPVDPRSDVFSLGAILYEILCQQPPFLHQSGEEAAAAAGNPSVGYAYRPLSGHKAAAWPIDEALDEVCARALSPRMADRYSTAGALAHEIEQFLEGTQEKDRRRRKAEELVSTAGMLHTSYDDLADQRPGRIEDYLALREQVAPWEPEERKQAVWDAEEQGMVMEALSVRTMQEVISTYEQALDEVPGHPEAQAGLARLYDAELRRAEERRDSFSRAYFEEKLRLVSEGIPRPLAALEIDTGDLEAEAQLFRFVEQRRRLIPSEERELGRTPLPRVEVEAGSYLLRLRRSAFQAIDYPLLLKPGEELKVQVDLLAVTELAESEVLIPGGLALLGGEGMAPRAVDVPTFILTREPITFGQYLQFVAEVCRTHPDLAENYLPLTDEGNPYWSWTGMKFRPAKILKWGDDPQRLLRLPVVGVDAWAAKAYAAWRTRRTGRVYRLPTEDEWEKAARGVDGRIYPWGDHFDASFCKMSESRPLLPAPEPSGAFADDVSPYGVRDMAGGVADWTVPRKDADKPDEELARFVSRGGAFCDPTYDCRLSSRRHYLAIERASRLGFRLARTPTGRAIGNQVAPMTRR